MPQLFPTFLKLADRPVLVVGGGPVAYGKIRPLVAAGARVTVVAPVVTDGIHGLGVCVKARAFEEADLEGVWFVVAAAPPKVNRRVGRAAEARRIWVNAVDDPDAATAYAPALVRKHGATIAVSTEGRAPALAGLLREGLEALLTADLEAWMGEADRLRAEWRGRSTPMAERRPQLLESINRLYRERDTS